MKSKLWRKIADIDFKIELLLILALALAGLIGAIVQDSSDKWLESLLGSTQTKSAWLHLDSS
jgi:hypothetical protein